MLNNEEKEDVAKDSQEVDENSREDPPALSGSLSDPKESFLSQPKFLFTTEFVTVTSVVTTTSTIDGGATQTLAFSSDAGNPGCFPSSVMSSLGIAAC